jgi:hypothetical protein
VSIHNNLCFILSFIICFFYFYINLCKDTQFSAKNIAKHSKTFKFC